MNLFEDIICAWLIGGLICGYMLATKPQKTRTLAWLIYIACTPFVPFVAYRICEIVR